MAPIPVIIVFAGEGIKEDMKSKLIMSGYGIEVEYDPVQNQVREIPSYCRG